MSETDLAEVWARSLEELATMQIELTSGRGSN